VSSQSPAHEALGSAIRSLRRERGLSQEALGFESGLDRTYVGGVERGERNPTLASLVTLANALDTSVESLMKKARL